MHACILTTWILNFHYYWNVKANLMISMCWKNGANRLGSMQDCHKSSICKNIISSKCSKVKHNKMRYTCTLFCIMWGNVKVDSSNTRFGIRRSELQTPPLTFTSYVVMGKAFNFSADSSSVKMDVIYCIPQRFLMERVLCKHEKTRVIIICPISLSPLGAPWGQTLCLISLIPQKRLALCPE